MPERILRMAGMHAGHVPDPDAPPQRVRLRMRVYVEGKIVDEIWLPGDTPDWQARRAPAQADYR